MVGDGVGRLTHRNSWVEEKWGFLWNLMHALQVLYSYPCISRCAGNRQASSGRMTPKSNDPLVAHILIVSPLKPSSFRSSQVSPYHETSRQHLYLPPYDTSTPSDAGIGPKLFEGRAVAGV